ncbi:MAG: hypothetical protein ABF868_01885 [Sporolactobacillus sp.]
MSRKKHYDESYVDEEGCLHSPCNPEPQPEPDDDNDAGLVHEVVTDQSLQVSPEPRPLLGNRFAEVCVNVKDTSSRVLLDGVVEWKPDGISLLGSIIGIINAGLIFGIPGVLRVWKRNADGSTPIAESRDTAQLLSTLGDLFNTSPTDEIHGVDFSFVTTPFHVVDNNPSKGANRYFLTLDLDTSVIPGSFLTNIIGLAGEPPKLSIDNVRNYSLTALEIGANPDNGCSHCC